MPFVPLAQAAAAIAAASGGAFTEQAILDRLISSFWRGEFENGDRATIITLEPPAGTEVRLDGTVIQEVGDSDSAGTREEVVAERERQPWSRAALLRIMRSLDVVDAAFVAPAAYEVLAGWPWARYERGPQGEDFCRGYRDRLAVDTGVLRVWCRERRLAPPLFESEKKATEYRTGTVGRPASIHLVRAEMERRAAAGRLEGSLTEEAQSLVRWLAREHPAAPPLKPKSIMNSLGSHYRSLLPKSNFGTKSGI